MWINFLFFHICRVWKSEIPPHDRFFSTCLTSELCDKYEVCVYHVHIAIFAQYHVHINRTLQNILLRGAPNDPPGPSSEKSCIELMSEPVFCTFTDALIFQVVAKNSCDSVA